MSVNFAELAQKYKSELLDSVMPFWLEKSLDREYGGYFTCLTREGDVYDKDKFIWLQGREVWMFAYLYCKVEKKPEWLEASELGAKFLKEHGHDGEYNFYFALSQDGTPQVEPYNIFSNTFAVLAFAQLAEATGNKEYEEIAKKSFDRILARVSNPKGKWNKASPQARKMKDFALPMILCNLTLEIENLIGSEKVQETIDTCVHEVLEVFYRPELGLIVENVNVDGTLADNFNGRLLNPGHALEATWFIMDLGVRLNKPEMIEKAVQISLNEIQKGWDEVHGGIFYFMDRLGYPPQQLEWDQKLWWVHIEAMISMIKGYRLTKNEKCLEWFIKLDEYCWEHFKDKEYPEWYGYLNRRGEPYLTLKGGKWKGCFHVPRGMYQLWQQLEMIANEK